MDVIKGGCDVVALGRSVRLGLLKTQHQGVGEGIRPAAFDEGAMIAMRLGGYGAVRGHLTRFDEEAWEWVYVDTLKPLGDGKGRACIRCGKMPTPEGHDACLGTLFGDVVSACCGHGLEPPYIMFEDGSELEGDEAIAFIEPQKKPVLHCTGDLHLL